MAAINPTSLWRNMKLVAEAPWDVLCVAEHATAHGSVRAAAATLAGYERRS